VKTTEYLYGVQPEAFKSLNYVDALVFKITSAKAQLGKLLYNFNYIDRDDYRVNDIIKAIKFNEQLLSELNLTYKELI